MNIIVDTRQKQGKHTLKHDCILAKGHKLTFKKLNVGDYMVEGGSMSVDTKQDLLEVCGNLFHDNKRFVREIQRAKKEGVSLIILIEEDGVSQLKDVRCWSNQNTMVSGKELEKRMLFFRNRYGVKFKFCNKQDTGEMIVCLLNNDRGN